MNYYQLERISHLAEKVTHKRSTLTEFFREIIDFLKESLGPFLNIVVLLLELFLEELILRKYLLFFITLESFYFSLQAIIIVLKSIDDLSVPSNCLLLVNNFCF